MRGKGKLASTLQHILVSPCPPHTHVLHHRINVVFAFATFAKRFLAPFNSLILCALFTLLPLFPLFPPPFSPPHWVYKPKCLTLALSCAHPSVIHTNPSLASRSHFLLSPHFVVLLVASFVCFSCCYKKLIRIVNFVFIRQADSRQQQRV